MIVSTIAYKDNKGNLYKTKQEAVLAEIVNSYNCNRYSGCYIGGMYGFLDTEQVKYIVNRIRKDPSLLDEC